MSPSVRRGLYALALFFAALPLWATDILPLVDLPQHLHLISVLHRLNDPTTLYPEVFAQRGQLTPYLGYYYVVSALNWLVPLSIANKLFLTAYVVGLPLSLAYLLSSLRRPTWPALLAVPFAYGDSLAWGFINYCSALPLTFLCCGLFVRTISDAARRTPRAIGLAACLVAVLLSHVQAFAFLAVALPVLLVMTRAPEDGERTWRAAVRGRLAALLGVLPGVLLFLLWVGIRLGEPAQVEYGAQWKAWGPLLSPQNLSYKSFDQNLSELVPVLANMLRDHSDQLALWAVAGVMLAGFLLSFRGSLSQAHPKPLWLHAAFGAPFAVCTVKLAIAFGNFLQTWSATRYQAPLPGNAWLWLLLTMAVAAAWRETVDAESEESKLERYRMLALATLALILFLALPFDIKGYMYYLNTRFAHLAAPLVVAAVPRVRVQWRTALTVAAAACAVLTGLALARGFSRFGQEAQPLEQLAQASAPRARVMGLIFDTSSAVVNHPVYLHSGAVLAREAGGYANFSFALTPHSPLKYRDEPPPTFPSEWRPDQFDYAKQGSAYDHFLVRGVDPRRIFGPLLETELQFVGTSGNFALVRRR